MRRRLRHIRLLAIAVLAVAALVAMGRDPITGESGRTVDELIAVLQDPAARSSRSEEARDARRELVVIV
jgi:hypothetical protein